jgi:hypothetical protein
MARARTIALSVCVGVLSLVRPGLAADVQFVSVGQGLFDVAGTLTGPPEEIVPPGYAGTLNIAIGPPFDGPLTEAYCIDIAKLINIGDIESEVTRDYPCQVVYILNNFYPNAASILSPISREAAAVQAAIWSFTDGFVVTDPPDVVGRASDIIAAANASNCVPVSIVPQSITVTPATALNFFPDFSHTVTATLIGSDGQPLANYPVTIDVTGASGSQSFPGTTNAAGQFTVTYTNPGTAGTDTITAKATFNLPLGLQFSAPDKQPIVLAGEPDAGIVQGSAQKTWKVMQDYHCYETHRSSLNRAGVSLVDAFGSSTVAIKRAKRFCAPTDDAAAPINPAHLTYYTLKQTSPKFFTVRDVVVTNQFGTLTVDVVKPDRLLVPTAKSLTEPPLPLATAADHYKCYRVAGARFHKADLALEDQFGTVTVDVKKPLHLCAPVDKNGEGVVDPSTFLMCYLARLSGPLNQHVNVFTQNQFGPDEFGIFGPRDLCVPSSVTLP